MFAHSAGAPGGQKDVRTYDINIYGQGTIEFIEAGLAHARPNNI